MENNSAGVENQLQEWLQIVLAKENLKNLSVDIAGNSEKGDGYIGEIFFLVARGTDKLGNTKLYNLVLKCSKASAALMASFPVRETFIREMYTYETVFPAFRQFQTERGIENPFDSVPKCYGTYTDGFRYVVVFENLKKIGYELWENGTPLTRRHVDLIVKEYAKFHAISVAMKEREPEKFQKLIAEIDENIFMKIFQCTDFVTPLETTIEEIAELLNDELSEDILKKWLSFKDQIHACVEMTPDHDDLKVITHADCWSNNFLYKYTDNDKSIPSKVAILDWQISKYCSPVDDLAYFLFSCISEEDVADMDTILRTYYETFCENVTKMGSTFMESYPVERLLKEWKKYSRFGLMMCLLPVKAAYSTKEDLPDMAKDAESGNFDTTFVFQITNKIACRDRFKPLVRYAVEAELI